MRRVKSIIGWLCLLSLVTAVGLFAGSLYLVAEPFWNGATIGHMRTPDLLAITEPLAEGGLDRSDSAILEKYANQESEPDWTQTGLEAAVRVMTDPSIEETYDSTPVAAAAVLDKNGRVVAAYPKELIGEVFTFAMPLANIADSQKSQGDGSYWFESANSSYPYWTSKFTQAVRRYAPDARSIMLAKIKDRDGKVTGILAVAESNQLLTLSIPSGSLDRVLIRDLQIAGLAALILHLLLLPLWVGMDAHWRGMRPFAWGALVALTNVIGLGAYLVARLPGAYPCGNCGEEVLGKYIRCPACGVSLMNKCPICRTKMKPGWQYCPVCNITPKQVLETTPPKNSAEPLATRLMESTRASLQVAVLDADTGDPMQNARVSVTGRMSKVDGITGVTGIFEARKLRSGRYTITTTKAGYEPAEAELDINEVPESVQLNLRALPARIIGRVVERDTIRPVAGVRVYIDSSRLERSTLTGAEGGFVLEDIAAGPYTVAVDAVGFRHQTRLAEVAPGQQVTLDFSIEPSENIV